MVIEIHSPSRGVPPRRALISAALLFACTSLLAAGMSWHRITHPLAVRIQPKGWPISFAPPRGWLPGLAPAPEPPTVASFYGVTRTGGAATSAFWWFTVRIDDDAEDVCYFVFDQHQATPRPDGDALDPPLVSAMLGPYEAYEMVDARGRVRVRAVILSNGDAHAVSLSVEKAAIDDHTYRMFDLACRSIRFGND